MKKINSPSPQRNIPSTATELEQIILGVLMVEKETGILIEFLKASDFSKPAHQEIYNAILELFNACEPIDVRLVFRQLSKNGKLEAAGGTPYVVSLSDMADKRFIPSGVEGELELGV